MKYRDIKFSRPKWFIRTNTSELKFSDYQHMKGFAVFLKANGTKFQCFVKQTSSSELLPVAI